MAIGLELNVGKELKAKPNDETLIEMIKSGAEGHNLFLDVVLMSQEEE